MQRLWLFALILTLVTAGRTEPARALGPADGPGCLGVTATECLQWLRATMRLDESGLAAAMARRHPVDVNGRPLGGGLVTVRGQLPDHIEPLAMLLHLRGDDIIVRAESNLLLSPLVARTEQVYDRTALYDIAWRLIGRRCPALARLDLYRFFENAVKPRIREDRQDVSSGLFGVHKVVSHAAPVPYCGVSLGYTGYLEWRGSAEPHNGRNVKTLWSIELQ